MSSIFYSDGGTQPIFSLKPGNAPDLQSTTKSNSGIFKASGGGGLGIHVPVTQTDAGQIVADGGTVQFFAGAALTGGSTLTANGGKLLLSGGGATMRVTDISNQGYWLVQDGAVASLGGTRLSNGGTFNVGGYTGGSGWGTLRLVSNVHLSGTGNLLLSPGIVDSPGGFTLTNDAGQSIHGYGSLNASLINDGTILADQGGQALTLGGPLQVNNAQIKAVNSGFLDIRTTVTQAGQGKITADDASTVRMYNGSAIVSGITATGAGGGFFVSGGGVGVTLTDCTNQGEWLVQDGSVVSLAGSSFANRGTFTIGGYTGGSGWGTLRLGADIVVSGTGTMLLSPGIIDSPAGYTLINQGGHTLRGYGEIRSGLLNSGVIDADRIGNLVLTAAAKSNQGTLKASNGRTLEIRTTINQAAGGKIQADGGFVWLDNGAIITGGLLESPNGGKFHSDSRTVTLTDTTNRGWLFGQNCARFLLTGSTFTNDGTFEIGGYTGGCGVAEIRPVAGLVLQGEGTVLLQPGYINGDTSGTLVNGAGHTIRGGYGRIFGNVVLDNRGTLEAFNGTLDLDAGPVQFVGNTLTGGSWKATNGALNINGAAAVTINQANVFLTGSGTLPQINALADNRGLFALAGGKIFTTGGALIDSGTITVDSASRLNVNGAYAAAAGSVTRIDGQFSSVGTATIQGMLSGRGTTGDIILGGSGTVAPGASSGVLTTGNLTVQQGAAYNWEYRNATDFDLVRVTGALDLGSAQLQLNITLLDGATAPDTIKLFEFGSLASPVTKSQILLPKYWSYRSIDTTGNQLSLVGVVYDSTSKLTVTFASPTLPKGGGYVAIADNSTNPPVITTCTGSPNPCVTSHLDGASLVLTPYPDGDSLFSSWSVGCSGSGSCRITLAGDQGATATFSFVKPAMMEGVQSQYFDTLQAAYDAAPLSGAVIRTRMFTFPAVKLNQSKNITIRGGYAPNYVERTGYTLLQGKLTVVNGSVVMERLMVK
jgi:hypothetical protein